MQKCEGLLYYWKKCRGTAGCCWTDGRPESCVKIQLQTWIYPVFSLFYVVASCAGGRLTIGIGTAHCVPKIL